MNHQRIRKYLRLCEASKKAHKELENYREKLKFICTHPEKFLSEYNWENDNGYGRQTKVKGKICGICYAVKLYETDTTWHRLENLFQEP